jgi:tetratricopeptide (TPR) repeat protein
VLVGEPGIGKTRTCQEFAEYARQRGAQALWGRCYEEQGMPPYWPWVQAIRTYVRERDAEALRVEMGAGAADIVEIVPDVKERLPDLRPAPEVDNPEQARFRLFDSITTFLKNAAQNQPLVLILDNLHGADKPSLLLLEFLAHELGGSRLLIVDTYQDLELTRQHPLSEALGELTRERLFQRLLLHGLASDDVSSYVAEVTGMTPPPGLVGAIHAQTEGNPLFVTEVVRLLAEEGQLSPGRLQQNRILSTSIPDGVREVIGRRLNRLSEGCVQTLTIASVIGREFSLAELERLTDYISEDRLLGALEEAVATQIIEELPQTVDRYQFTHVLIRETLYDELTNSRRARLHRRIGEAMEDLYCDDLEPYLARLASHFFAAARSGSADKALEYCARAGERDVALLAYEEAVRHYEMALRALELQQPSDETQRGKLLLALGGALSRAGGYSQAMETFQQAAGIFKKLGRREALAQAALGFEEASWRPGFYGAPAVLPLEEALNALPIGDSALKARVLGSLTRALYFLGSPERAYTVGQRALEMARRVDDPFALVWTLNIAYYSRRRPEDLQERLTAATEIIKLSAESPESNIQAETRVWPLFDLIEAGKAQEFKAGLAIFEREAERIRQPFYLYVVASCQAALAIAEGRFEEGEQIAKQALLIDQRFKGHDPTGVFGLKMFTIRREQRRLTEVAPAVKMFVQQHSAAAAWRPGLALIYSELGLEAEARAEFEHLSTNDFGNIPQDALWIVCLVYLAEVCAFLGDVRQADILYRLLLPYDGHNVVVGAGWRTWGPPPATWGCWPVPCLTGTKRSGIFRMLWRWMPG